MTFGPGVLLILDGKLLLRVLSVRDEWVTVQRWKRRPRAWTRRQRWVDSALRRYTRVADDTVDHELLGEAGVSRLKPFPLSVRS